MLEVVVVGSAAIERNAANRFDIFFRGNNLVGGFVDKYRTAIAGDGFDMITRKSFYIRI